MLSRADTQWIEKALRRSEERQRKILDDVLIEEARLAMLQEITRGLPRQVQ